MFRADRRPKVLFADAHAAACGRLADSVRRNQHGPKRAAKGRWGVRGHSPDMPFLTQEKKYSVFYLFCCVGGSGRGVA